jgi:hypothetical protein
MNNFKLTGMKNGFYSILNKRFKDFTNAYNYALEYFDSNKSCTCHEEPSPNYFI